MRTPIQERLGFANVKPVTRGDGADGGRLTELADRLVRELRPRRALTFLDLETTGLDPVADRIVEISLARIEPDGSVERFETLVHPGVPLPPQATRIHGIDDALVAAAPAFAEIAAPVRRLLDATDLAGYNLARFDLPLLAAEFERAGLEFDWRVARVVDACVVFKRMERRDLESALRFYCGAAPVAGHTAAGDMMATLEVLLGQLRRYPQLARDVARLDALWRPPVSDDESR